MSWVQHKSQYQKLAWAVDPSVVLTTKDSWFWKVLAAVYSAVTFQFSTGYHSFLRNYATTLGPVQAYPAYWPRLDGPLLIHEATHTRDARWCGFGIHPWVGLPVYALLYLLFVLPLGFAVARWRFEIRAEKKAYVWALNHGYSESWVRSRAKSFGQKVCGADYGWSWLFGGVQGFINAGEAAIREVARGGR